jgi:hypothetical protein
MPLKSGIAGTRFLRLLDLKPKPKQLLTLPQEILIAPE